ncbi:hypothetical protein BGZ60DRAFT_471377 [Tricladium varicosporioides]|nr:hypothetical protein BGZ60DRAFT_471377 [Hymenoscyphus varicosporioides]
MADKALPNIKWGILGTGWVSTNFAKDLMLTRPNAPINHTISALGTSSLKKGSEFLQAIIPSHKPQPKIYEDYSSVYSDPDVDIVYVGTPHSLHLENCLAAIEKGKHVLCEKPLAINEKQSKVIVDAAREKGVFLMEAVWTRFFPLIRELNELLHSKKIIGDISRMFCDFGLNFNMTSLPSTSRLKNRDLGAGALLDMGIYPLMFANICMDGKVGHEADKTIVTADMDVRDGIDYSDAVIIRYPFTNRIAILTASLLVKSPEEFCRIEGSKGSVIISGPGTSVPNKFTVVVEGVRTEYKYEHEGMGFWFEADAVALDILAGKKENDVVPWAESLRMMGLMDEIRRAGGVTYPQDE